MEENDSVEKRLSVRRRSFFKNSGSPISQEPASSVNGNEEEKQENQEKQEDQEQQKQEVESEKDNRNEASENSEVKIEEGNEVSEPHKIGRKRKASEMKPDDTISEESSNKAKPLIPDKSSEQEKASTDSEMEIDDLRGIEASLKSDSDKMNLLQRQPFGKGKRARIPNKRYSDFPLTPSKAKSIPSELIDQVQNGETKENLESESGSTSDLSGSRSSHANSPATAIKKSKATVDLSNPDYLKPFQYGWRRELVYRATSDNLNKRNGDIYYFTPSGKKVRSMREVSENLKEKNLSLSNFTFFKEPLGLNDPEKETIRDAKVKHGSEKKHAVASPRVVTKSSTVATPPVLSPASPKVNKEVSEPPAAVEVPKSVEPKVKKTPTPNLKVKLTPAKGKVNKAKQKKKEEELQIGTLPPTWQSPKKSPTRAATKSTEAKRSSKRLAKTTATHQQQKQQIQQIDTLKSPEKLFMDNFLQNLSFGYNTLLFVFQYLKMQDLLRASCVCKMWRDIASHHLLWHTVRMKNSQIHSFEGLADALKAHGTVHLDLRKMLLPGNGDEIWPEFSRAIKKVDTLRKIELCRCPATVVEQLALSNSKLEVINAVTIKCESMGLAPLVYVKNLQELRLKSTSGFSLTSDLTALSDLKHLKHLSLTSIKDLHNLNIDVIADLSNLISLELGECTDFPKSFGHDILSRLHKLEKLRMEKGQGNCHTFEILDAVKGMPQMEQLELVNFDIKPGFDKALGACNNIKKLLIIPTYISQSATTNHMVLGGVLRLQSTLSHFVWGVTLELLRVTELFVDQCEDPDKKEKKDKRSVGNGDSIPVLKPVPLLRDGQTTLDIPPAQDPPQVEILPLPNLQKLLLQSLPTTRVKILKIPFHATWRQSITDTVN